MNKLYMVILGCSMPGRFIEQHDVFFGVSDSIKGLVPDMKSFWPEAKDRLHIDSYREVNIVGEFEVTVVPRSEAVLSDDHLFFINLGGYKPNDMEEYHYKYLVVAKSMAEAIHHVKASEFWSQHNSSHVDDKYGIDIDDIYLVDDMLSAEIRAKYALQLVARNQHRNIVEDELRIGYLKLSKLEKED